MNNRRFDQLDSLRGIAAVIVVFYHMYMIIPHVGPIWKLISYTPFKILFAGNESVILFFVLSGFVLSLPFLQQNVNGYFSFIIKRVCRIYIPYMVAISVAIIACALLSKGGIKGLSSWFNTQWVSTAETSLILNHYFLLGNFNVYSYDVVLWSLIHEMRISIVFPVLKLLTGKFNWKVNIVFGVILSLIGGALHLYFNDPYQAMYKTLPYMLMFIVGILLATNKQFISARYSKLNTTHKVIILIIGILIYNYSSLLQNQILVNWTITLGASIIILTAIFSVRLSNMLLIIPLKFLGKISYSLYLFHVPILLSCVYFFYGIFPISLIFVISFVLSLGVSTFSWYFIENPSTKLGRKLANSVDGIRIAKRMKN